MSNITGDGGSFSSGTNAGEDEEHHQQQLLHHHLLNGPSAAGAYSNVSTSQLPPPPPPLVKKKRNLPGNPDPTAEVIALSPRALMATNRFICEICHKGFQRDQNLQLHRRGHNLPWKLRQRTSTENRKRVYVCPVATCVHHNPIRALGDLTGIKKHYCRKHGEKKWKCDKCSKRYAVQSDWKAHSKTCGNRDYKCDCGTSFSRRDSFITHRAFCDALAQENNKLNEPSMATMASSLQGHHAPNLMLPINANATSMSLSDFSHDDMKSSSLKTLSDNLSPTSLRSLGYNQRTTPSSSLQLSGSGPMGFDGLRGSAHMSATALLQKAAQIGATATRNNITPTMMQRGFPSIMAGPDRASGTGPYGLMKAHGPCDQMQPQGEKSQLIGINGGITNQFYGPLMNHTGVFTTIGMTTSGGDGFLKNVDHGGGGGRRGGNVMTVDFLGVEGQRSLHHQQQQQQQQAIEYEVGHQQRLEGLQHLQQHIGHGPSIGKPMWYV